MLENQKYMHANMDAKMQKYASEYARQKNYISFYLFIAIYN